MVNLAQPYNRPALSLTTLREEINAVWPNRRPDLGFVTGYKSAENFTAHNPNNFGIVMGYDIGTYITGSINEPDGRDLAEFLRVNCYEKLQYLIHDMGTEAQGQRPMIAGNHTNWKWAPYAGSSPHSDHIHLSIVDLYWGDATSVPASVYDSTSSWGVLNHFRNLSGQGTGVTPIKPKDDSMSAADVTALKAHINAIMLGPYSWADGNHPKGVRGDILAAVETVPNRVWATPVTRGGEKISALQDLANGTTAANKAIAEVAALRATVDQLAASTGKVVDYDLIGVEITKALATGVDLQATVNIKKD